MSEVYDNRVEKIGRKVPSCMKKLEMHDKSAKGVRWKVPGCLRVSEAL